MFLMLGPWGFLLRDNGSLEEGVVAWGMPQSYMRYLEVQLGSRKETYWNDCDR